MSDLINIFSDAGLWIEASLEPHLPDDAAARFPHKQEWMNKYLGILISGTPGHFSRFGRERKRDRAFGPLDEACM